MLAGRATEEGTRRYAGRFSRLPADHFRRLDGLTAASLGIGTYLGAADPATDALYARAIADAVGAGFNVVDTAVNYRDQRSERAVGQALAHLVAAGTVGRDEVIVATKGGFVPFDRRTFARTYVEAGRVRPDELVAGCHCLAPAYLADQIELSRANLGCETLDVYYVHNPETQLAEVGRPVVHDRLRAAFAALEAAVAAGAIARYGTATWDGYREPPDAPGHLELAELVALAREVGGERHHFRVLQVPYNLAMTEAFTVTTQKVDGAAVSLLEAARRLGVYVMTSASVYQGQLARNLPAVVAEYIPGLTTDAQRALQFVRSTPGVGTALVGMKRPEHVAENAGVARRPPMAWDDFQRLFTHST